MLNDLEQFDVFADMLRNGLSLIGEDEYNKLKQQELAEKYSHLSEALEKGLDELELGEQDLIIMDELNIMGLMPKSFRKQFGSNEYVFDSKSLYTLQKEQPKFVRQFLHELSKNELVFSKKDDLNGDEANDEIDEGKYEPIEVLLEKYQIGDEEEKESVVAELEDRFLNQSNECQIQIINTILPEKTTDRDWWYRVLLDYWWDDGIVPAIETTWKCYREPECARVIAHRFPLEYVKSHQEDLGKDNYLAVCLRLAQDKDFVIDKIRLSKKQYYHILAARHIHLVEAEADNLLFGHVFRFLDIDYKPPKYAVDNDYCHTTFDIDNLFSNQEKFLSLMFDYKPSLLFLPDMAYYIQTLINTGNVNTVVKFIAWNKYLQQNIPSLLLEESDQTIALQQFSDRFREYRSRSWELLVELAIETFPVKITAEVKRFLDDAEYNEWDVFKPY